MEELKYTIGILAVFLTFIGYVPYIRDTIKGKTKPHAYSWFLWSASTGIVFALQVSDGAGIGALITIAAVLIAGFIFVLSLRAGKQDITRSDTIFFILSLIALVIWLFAKQPVISVILLSVAELLAFIPTIRKSWNNPHSETLSSYLINISRFTMGIYALQNYSIITTFYPVSQLLANGVFSISLMVRRRQLAKK